MSQTWEPWKQYEDVTPPMLPIVEPPCRTCKFFKPHATFGPNGNFSGVRICISQEMFHDFSCYKQKVAPQLTNVGNS